MRVVLDTNTIYRSGGRRLLGTEVELIAKSKLELNITIYIPEVVLEELSNLYAEEYRSLKKDITRISHLIVKEAEKPKIPVNIKALGDYKRALNKRLTELGVRRVKHDNITHRPILDRIFNRRKPFPTDGKHTPDSSKGYRDSLIWEMICTEVADKRDKTIFVTANWKDFAESKTLKNELHPHLKEDLKNLGLQEDAVVLCHSLEDFNHRYIKPHFDLLEDIRSKIEKGTLPYFIVPSFFKEHFDDILSQAQDYMRDMEDELGEFLGEDVSGIYLPSMYDPNDIRVIRVRKITSTEVLVSAEIDVEVEIEFFLHKSTAWTLDDDSAISVHDYDWNEWMAEAGVCISITLELDFIIDQDKKEVTDFDIVAIRMG